MCAHSLHERHASADELFELCRAVVAAGGMWRMIVQGDSMLPTIKPNSQITLVACPQPVPLGAIVLARNTHKVVLHRVVRRKAGLVLLAGDANRHVDDWLPVEGIAAQLISWHYNDITKRETSLQRWYRVVILWIRYLRAKLRRRHSSTKGPEG